MPRDKAAEQLNEFKKTQTVSNVIHPLEIECSVVKSYRDYSMIPLSDAHESGARINLCTY